MRLWVSLVLLLPVLSGCAAATASPVPPAPPAASSTPTPAPTPAPTVPPVDPEVPPVTPTVPPVEPTPAPTVPPVDPEVPPVTPTVPPVDPEVPPVEPTVPPVGPEIPPVEPTVPPVVPAPIDGAPVPVSETLFTEAARGPVSSPSSATEGGSITITVGIQYAGETVDVWVHSTPVLLGTTVVRADGTVRVTLPAGLTGEHRIAVVAEDGTLIGWDNVTIAATETLASTGADLGGPIRAALILLLAGAGLLVLRRRQATA